MKKKKQKPPKIHLVHPMMVPMKEMAMEEKGRGFGRTQSWVVGESPRLENATQRKGRNVMTDVWNMGEKALDAVAEHAMKKDEVEDGISDKSSVEGGWWMNGSVVCNVFYLFISHENVGSRKTSVKTSSVIKVNFIYKNVIMFGRAQKKI